MIKIEYTKTYGWESVIRGMRNPLNSWDKSDSKFVTQCGDCDGECEKYHLCDGLCVRIGDNDHDLMMRLAKGGSTHAKYRRMIVVTCDITAPLYWWKEFDTYKVGTVANSCSTMHTIHKEPFVIDDFSHEHLFDDDILQSNVDILQFVIDALNFAREDFIATNDKRYWWQMIQLLPSSYNQKRTVQLNYEGLVGMYRDRKNHKLDEWRTFCDWVMGLPYSEIITVATDELQRLREENLELRADLEATIAGQLTLQKALAKHQNNGVTQ